MTKPIIYNLTDPKYSGWCSAEEIQSAIAEVKLHEDYMEDECEEWNDNGAYHTLLKEIVVPLLGDFNSIYQAKQKGNSKTNLEDKLKKILTHMWGSLYHPETNKFFDNLDDGFVLDQVTRYIKKPKEVASVDFLLTMAEYLPEDTQPLLKAKMEIYEEARDIVLGHTGCSSYGVFPKKLTRAYFGIIQEKIASMDGKIKPPRDLVRE